MENASRKTRLTPARLALLGAVVLGLGAAAYVVLLLVDRIRADKDKLASAANLHAIGAAVNDYESHYRRFPPQAITSEDGKPLLSWRVALLPFLGENALHNQFKLDEPWDSTHNKKLLERMPEIYRHPAVKPKEPGMTHYQAFAGKGTMFEPNQRIGSYSIQDGTFNTVMLVEAAEPVPWTKPADLPYDRHKPLAKLGGIFSTFHAVFCDGHLRSIEQDFDEQLMRRIIERDDGLPVGLNDLYGLGTPVRNFRCFDGLEPP